MNTTTNTIIPTIDILRTSVQGGFGQVRVRIHQADPDALILVHSVDVNGMNPTLIATFNPQLGVRWDDVVQMAKDSDIGRQARQG